MPQAKDMRELANKLYSVEINMTPNIIKASINAINKEHSLGYFLITYFNDAAKAIPTVKNKTGSPYLGIKLQFLSAIFTPNNSRFPVCELAKTLSLPK